MLGNGTIVPILCSECGHEHTLASVPYLCGSCGLYHGGSPPECSNVTEIPEKELTMPMLFLVLDAVRRADMVLARYISIAPQGMCAYRRRVELVNRALDMCALMQQKIGVP